MKKRFTAIPFLGFALMIGLFQSCRKNDYIPDPVYLPSELKAYSMFQNGTYWVYRNRQSGQIDSVYVQDFQSAVNDTYEGQRLIGRAENFSFRVISSLTGQQYEHQSGLRCIDKAYDPIAFCHTVGRYPIGPNGSPSEGNEFLFYQPIVGSELLNGFGRIRLTAVHDTMSIAGTVYRQVIEVQVDRDLSEQLKPTRYFSAKNIGLVRRDVIDNGGQWNRWELIRQRIIQ